MSLKDWEKLNVTRDEVEKIGEALKQKEFRQLLIDYCEEISDPENKKLYEKEITELENQRGVDITFINPEPGYVIKTSSEGTTKTFINIATSEKVERPSSKPSTENGQRGLVWSLPHTLAPPRRDADKKGSMCHVYDVVFHPDAFHLAKRNNAFRQLVNDTAIDAVQQAFKVKLDRTNIKFPKISYKGMVKPAVIRKKIDNFDISSVEPSPIDGIYPPVPEESKPQVVKHNETPADIYTSPKYKIVQKRELEFQELTNEPDAKLNLTIPHEIVVTIDLPLLNTTQDANLDVTNKKITLCSEKPAKYKLEIMLPYEVDEEKGTAKFDKAKRQLIIVLPVVRVKSMKITDFLREDSGIESDQPICGKEKLDEESDESPLISTIDEEENDVQNDNKSFLDPNIEYVLPNFTFNQIDDIIAFTLHVKNVDASSIVIDRKDLQNIAHIKFSSIGSGFFPIHYSFCVKFPSQLTSIFREITAEAWDNNVIFQFELNNYDFSSYETGIDEKNLISYDIAERLIGRQAMTSQGKQIEDDSLCIEVRSDKEENELVIEVKKEFSNKKSQETSNDDDEVSEDVFDDQQSIIDSSKRHAKKAMRKRAKKGRSMSESYCDQLKVISELEYPKKMDKSRNEDSKNRMKNKTRSMSESSDDDHITEIGDNLVQSHHKYKSILKIRNAYSECNESSVDEQSKSLYSISADFGICESHDSLSESCKKQVRFSDIIKRQLFRSNTSILGQKKKNQKKKASRQRALERRHSEGSESEKHDEDFDEKGDEISQEESNEKPQKRDSGVDLNEKCVNKKENIKIKNKSRKAEKVVNGNDIHFKSGMIFDLEM